MGVWRRVGSLGERYVRRWGDTNEETLQWKQNTRI